MPFDTAQWIYETVIESDVALFTIGRHANASLRAESTDARFERRGFVFDAARFVAGQLSGADSAQTKPARLLCRVRVARARLFLESGVRHVL